MANICFDRLYAVCTSDAIKLLKNWICRSDLIVTHLNGVTRRVLDLENRKNLRQKFLALWSEELGVELPLNGRYIGVVGRLSFEKNHAGIFSLFKKLLGEYSSQASEQNTQIYLLVFGSGPLEQELKQGVHVKGLKNQILFMGYQSEMSEKMGALDMIWSLSLAEGLPINIIEAGWAGTPVLANAIDGNKDLMSDPSLGFIMPEGGNQSERLKKLLLLISDKERIDSMGQAFQKHVKVHFSEERWLAELQDNYKQLGVEL
jgi:glycosyltransferase involved in cell wall biosynthesis